MKPDIVVPAAPAPFKPLVVGAPRSGFALLASVLIHFVPLAPRKSTIAQEVLNAVIEAVGDILSESIVREFAANGITDDLVYNPNFRRMAGGPRWLREDNVEFACFRKYIGVRGLGDFTLVTSHPREILDVDEVVHSHTDPGLWLRHSGYADYTKFASLRNPVGILNSSVFSINALASDYIQRFVPRDRDNDLIRQQLALYKLTDLNFVRGLVRFLVGYLEEFVQHWRSYYVMRWEDLIVAPVPTILQLASDAGVHLREAEAARLWSRLDHVNLTGHHRHNYREGKGIVGNWRQWLVNEHLELFTSMGLEPLMLELGYGHMPYLDEREYTPFQRRAKEFITAGEICKETEDEDLFTFAFNKSNISSEAFPFKRREWRTWTRIERSIFTDEPLEQRISDVAEEMAGRLNAVFSSFLSRQYEDIGDVGAALDQIERDHADTFSLAPARAAAAFERARQVLRRAADAGRRSTNVPAVPYHPQPLLVESLDGYNIVAFQETYYGIPQSMGEFRLDEMGELDERIVRGSTRAEVVAAVSSRAGAHQSRDDAGKGAPDAARRARLEFADPLPEIFAAKCRQYLKEGYRRLLLMPFNEFARTVHEHIASEIERADAHVLAAATDVGAPPHVASADIHDADVVVICAREEPEVSAALMALVDVQTATVLAARTSRFWADNPLFLISIPKAGTHLLYSLAKVIGYTPAVVLQDDPAPGAWYCVEFSNSHTVARDFFVDTVRRSCFGNRHHPFMRSPAVFIYRNPLDIVASEASYYHKDGNTAFAGYLSALTPEERLLRLIDDPWLLGSIRDRVGGFLPWLDFPNVIPVSFEELVGEEGGGSAEVQRQVIWSLQLKLHVAGEPEQLTRGLFDRSSQTFDTSRIGRYREAFSPEAYRRFFALPQDFMAAYGYERSGPDVVTTLPRRRDEFRRRPLQVSQVRPEVPINIQFGYFGLNIVQYRDCYIAVRQSDGELDLATSDLDALTAAGRIMRAATAEEARRGVERLALTAIVDAVNIAQAGSADAAAPEPRDDSKAQSQPPRGADVALATAAEDVPGVTLPVLVASDYSGFNIIQYAGRYYAASQNIGPIDLRTADIAVLASSGRLLVAESQEGVQRLVDELHSREANDAASAKAAGPDLIDAQKLIGAVAENVVTIANLTRVLNEWQQRTETLSRGVALLTQTSEAVRTDLSALESMVSKAVDELTRSVGTHDEMIQRLFRESAQRTDAMQKDVTFLQRERDLLRANLQAVEGAVRQFGREMGDKNQLIARERSRVGTLEQRLEEFRSSVEAKDALIERLAAEAAELQAWIEELQLRLVSSR